MSFHSLLCVTVVVALAGVAVFPLAATGQDDVAVCGGFVKPSPKLAIATPADLSHVRVRLISAEGLLKSETECAPNGYFFVPVYDAGAYDLEVAVTESAGWTFEATRQSITLSEDGVISCADDIDFLVTGFSVTASVQDSEGAGVPNVQVTLSGAKAAARTATSDADGTVVFSGTAPGTYTVTASHDGWRFAPSSAKVEVTWGSAQAAQALTIAAFDAVGAVTTGSAGAGVSAAVWVVATGKPGAVHCDPIPVDADIPAAVSAVRGTPLCVVQSNSDGTYSFAGLVPGSYEAVPVFDVSGDAKFDVAPATAAFTVAANRGVVTIESFVVRGFTLQGRVTLPGQAQRGVAGARVLLNGEQASTTDAQGEYSLEGLVAGSYSLTAEKKSIQFAKLADVAIHAGLSALPPITATSFDVCGVIDLANAPAAPRGASPLLPRNVVLTGGEGAQTKPTLAQTDKNGVFCFQAAPGRYTVTAVVTDDERRRGIVLSPGDRSFTVTDKAVMGLEFAPARVRVSGSVSCLGAAGCTGFSAQLTAAASSKKRSTIVAKDGSFAFDNVWPGAYSASVSNKEDSVCWGGNVPMGSDPNDGAARKEITVSDEDYTGVSFKQGGTVMTVTSDHAVSATLGEAKKSGVEVQVPKGKSRLCVPGTDAVVLKPVGCVKFNKKAFKFSPAKPKAITMTRRAFRITGTLAIEPDVQGSVGPKGGAGRVRVLVAVTGGGEGIKLSEEPKEASLSQLADGLEGQFTYSFTAPPGAEVTVTAVNTEEAGDKQLLFYPPTRVLQLATNQCGGPVPHIVARPGLYLNGFVTPALDDVTITVAVNEEADADLPPGLPETPTGVVATTTTDASGKYNVGPLHSGLVYTMTAAKSGYHLEQLGPNADDTSTGANFVHKRLGQVTVGVVDSVTGSPVSGVLLSLSRDRLRFNNATGADGTHTFGSLFPGDYFVRPILKEYTFVPPSDTASITEGGVLELNFEARRVAFSAYGSARSLAGVAESGLVVQASAPGAPHESTTTDVRGEFRLRGLKPGVAYTVTVTDSAKAKATSGAAVVQRITPPNAVVAMEEKDVKGLDFVVTREPTTYTLTGSVLATTEALALGRVSVRIARASAAHLPIASMPLDLTRYFEFSGLAAGKYIVSVAADGLDSRTYDISAPTVAVGFATVHGGSAEARQHVRLSYDAKVRALDAVQQDDAPVSSLAGLLVAIALVVAVAKREQFMPVLEGLRGGSKAATEAPASAGAGDKKRRRRKR